MNTRLIFAVLHWKKSQVDAVVERAGVRRKVSVTWHAKEQSDVPPANWFDMVVGELDNQDAAAFARARGLIME